jgi:hypothetical protein
MREWGRQVKTQREPSILKIKPTLSSCPNTFSVNGQALSIWIMARCLVRGCREFMPGGLVRLVVELAEWKI